MIPLRLYLYGGALIAAVCAWLYVSHLQHEITKQRERAVAAEASAAMRSVETKAIEQFHHDTKIIRETVEKEADAVEAIPSNDLPGDVRPAWLLGLSNVTNSAAADPD